MTLGRRPRGAGRAEVLDHGVDMLLHAKGLLVSAKRLLGRGVPPAGDGLGEEYGPASRLEGGVEASEHVAKVAGMVQDGNAENQVEGLRPKGKDGHITENAVEIARALNVDPRHRELVTDIGGHDAPGPLREMARTPSGVGAHFHDGFGSLEVQPVQKFKVIVGKGRHAAECFDFARQFGVTRAG